jgi:CheY-like chemotaxis protein
MIDFQEDPLNLEGKTILIGEDEMVNYRLLEIILGKTKANLIHGADGAETLRLYNTNPQTDLILIDIKMPLMDGCEVIREIRKNNTAIPIIAQTAYAVEDEKEKAFEAGCNAYINKPIRKAELLKVIHSYLSKE